MQRSGQSFIYQWIQNFDSTPTAFGEPWSCLNVRIIDTQGTEPRDRLIVNHPDGGGLSPVMGVHRPRALPPGLPLVATADVTTGGLLDRERCTRTLALGAYQVFPGDDQVRAQVQVVCGRSSLSAIARAVLVGTLLSCDAAIQDDLHLPVILKALDEEFIQLRVMARNDEQVPRSCQGNGLVTPRHQRSRRLLLDMDDVSLLTLVRIVNSHSDTPRLFNIAHRRYHTVTP